MSATLFDQWAKNSTFNYQSLYELGGITTRFCSELMRHNLEASSELTRFQSQKFNELKDIKNPQDYLSKQTEWVVQETPKLFEQAEKLLSTYKKGTEEYMAWFEKSLNTFASESAKTTGAKK